jgi:ketol-acid reductoisomerase
VRDEIAPALPAGSAVGFAHGVALAFGAMEFPPNVDVILVAPAGPGVELRELYVAGRGIPALVAIHQDASGNARDRALAYAKAIGCTRAGVYETTVRNEAVVDLFGEQAALCGGLAELVSKAYETLTEAGYPSELAYLECVHQLRLTANLISRFGIQGMWDAISRTARFGGLERGPEIVGPAAAEAMTRTLARIESGQFYQGFMSDYESGSRALEKLRREARREDLERVGERIRRRFQ